MMEISQQLAQAIAQYLMTRPWNEVNGLLQELEKAHQQGLAQQAQAEQAKLDVTRGASSE